MRINVSKLRNETPSHVARHVLLASIFTEDHKLERPETRAFCHFRLAPVSPRLCPAPGARDGLHRD